MTVWPGSPVSSSGTPSVSLVVPTYNKADYLAEAVDSVLRQDYPRLELLVVDDGSTDRTRSVLAAYGDRVRWWHQPNAGQATSLNRGWARTSGEIVGYLSGDDVLLPNAVSTLVRNLLAAPGAVCAYGSFELIDSRSRRLRVVRAADFEYRAAVTRFHCPIGPGVVFRRDAAARVGFWNPAYRLGPDHDFWLRLGLHGRFVRVPEVLARFRVHPESLSSSAVDEDLSGEYVRVMASYFRNADVPPGVRRLRNEAVSGAHVLAARSHLRSGRGRAASRELARAVRIFPANALRPWTARVLANGLWQNASRRGHGWTAGSPARPVCPDLPERAC